MEALIIEKPELSKKKLFKVLKIFKKKYKKDINELKLDIEKIDYGYIIKFNKNIFIKNYTATITIMAQEGSITINAVTNIPKKQIDKVKKKIIKIIEETINEKEKI